jgi:hypothetical protein
MDRGASSWVAAPAPLTPRRHRAKRRRGAGSRRGCAESRRRRAPPRRQGRCRPLRAFVSRGRSFVGRGRRRHLRQLEQRRQLSANAAAAEPEQRGVVAAAGGWATVGAAAAVSTCWRAGVAASVAIRAHGEDGVVAAGGLLAVAWRERPSRCVRRCSWRLASDRRLDPTE